MYVRVHSQQAFVSGHVITTEIQGIQFECD